MSPSSNRQGRIRDQQALEFLRLISNLSAACLSRPPSDLDAAIEDSLQHIVTELGIDRSTLVQLNSEDRLEVTHSWASGDTHRISTDLSMSQVPWLGERLRAGERVIFSKISELPDDAAVDKVFLREHGPKSSVILPLRVGEEYLGNLAFGAVQSERSWSEELIERLQVVAQIVASAIVRRRTDRALRNSEEQYREIFASSTDGLIVRSLEDDKIVAVNHALAGLYGCTREEFLQLSPSDYIHPESLELFASKLDAAREGKESEFTAQALRVDGSTVPVEIRLTPFRYQGRIHSLGAVRDVGERLRFEEELKRLALAFEIMEDGVVLTDAQGRVTGWNRGAEALFGFSKQEAVGRIPSELLQIEAREKVDLEVARALERDGRWQGELTVLRQDGAGRICATTIVPHRSKDGEVVARVGVNRDVTEKRLAERELRNREEQYRGVFEATSNGLTIRRASDFALVAVNSAMARMLGYTTAEFMELSPSDYMHPDTLPEFDEMKGVLAAGRTFRFEGLKARKKDGDTIRVAGHFKPFRYQGQDHILGVTTDITRRVRAQVESQRAFEEVLRLKDELKRERDYLREEVDVKMHFGEIIGQSAALQRALTQARAVASTDASVLILGESGVGKELIARAIHRQSRRADAALIKVNCSSIPAELFESEFFGHVKGAFTGAIRDRVGRFELAQRGTLFLDEVGEIPFDLQGKLLRVLQEKTFERVGDERTRVTDARIIAATNRDLEEEVAQGLFRSDLFYRLGVFPIVVPPLRERREDIVPLATHFLRLFCQEQKRDPLRLTKSHAVALEEGEWSGNVRQLRNTIERAVILSSGDRLRLDAVLQGMPSEPSKLEPLEPQDQKRDFLTAAELRERERANLAAALEASAWKVSGPGGAAELLGLKPSTLSYQMKAMRIRKPTR